MSKKNKNGVVYSTNPNFQYSYEKTTIQETLVPEKQNLKIQLETKNRKGKGMTVIQGFVGKEADIKSLGKSLKSLCGTGGSVKEGLILIQGDQRNKIQEYLTNNGYKVKQSGR